MATGERRRYREREDLSSTGERKETSPVSIGLPALVSEMGERGGTVGDVTDWREEILMTEGEEDHKTLTRTKYPNPMNSNT